MKHVAGRREPQVTDCFLNLVEAEVGGEEKPLKSIHCHGGAASERFAHDYAQTRPLYYSDICQARKRLERAPLEKR